jgi:hypothetical protein
MKRISAALIILLGLATAALAQGSSPVAVATQKSIAVAISSATTTKLITENGTQSIYVTAADIIAAGTGNIQFISGTGATCGTSSANVTGNYNLTAQVGFTKGSGNGVVWVVPPGMALCAVTSAGVGMAGSIAYAQF